MLKDGGDLYEGIIYAINNRYGWGYKNAADMYKLWDNFKIEESKMLGCFENSYINRAKYPSKAYGGDVLSGVQKMIEKYYKGKL